MTLDVRTWWREVGGRNNDPCGDPLRLLPSGPDRVGELPVRRRPPGGCISRRQGSAARPDFRAAGAIASACVEHAERRGPVRRPAEHVAVNHHKRHQKRGSSERAPVLAASLRQARNVVCSLSGRTGTSTPAITGEADGGGLRSGRPTQRWMAPFGPAASSIVAGCWRSRGGTEHDARDVGCSVRGRLGPFRTTGVTGPWPDWRSAARAGSSRAIRSQCPSWCKARSRCRSPARPGFVRP